MRHHMWFVNLHFSQRRYFLRTIMVLVKAVVLVENLFLLTKYFKHRSNLPHTESRIVSNIWGESLWRTVPWLHYKFFTTESIFSLVIAESWSRSSDQSDQCSTVSFGWTSDHIPASLGLSYETLLFSVLISAFFLLKLSPLRLWSFAQPRF